MSEAKDAKKPEEAAPHGAPAAKSSKLLPALVGLNSLLLIAVMGFLFMQMKKSSAHPPEATAEAKGEKDKGDEAAPAEHGEAKAEHKAEPEKKEPEKKAEGGKEEHGGGTSGAGGKGGLGPLVKISDFVIHLRNPEIDRYARLSFDVEVIADSDKDSLNAHMPRVRDAFISYLSDRTLEELQGAEGLGRTKEALQSKLRDLVPEARVRNLYISDFVVQ
ncbi:MAG: flagellar basal body-associated FliL family protein [Archangium sp.]|nr:flagellar basal body-associated FliL family protein [Archangium sp.]